MKSRRYGLWSCWGLIILFIFIGISRFGRTCQATVQLPTSVEVLVACGDGLAELPAEICDPGSPPATLPDVGTTTCAQYNDIYGNPFATGTMNCLLDCSDFDPGYCYTCGNGNKELAEQCDGSDFGGSTCVTFGLLNGNLLCSSECLISLSSCISQPSAGSGSPSSGSRGGASGSSSGFSPGSLKPQVTKVVMIGKSYPHSEVHVLLDGSVLGIVETDAKADFYFETTNITPGVNSFGFWSEDKDGIKSTLLTLTVRVMSNAVTTITGIYLSPSINTDKKSVLKGEPITIYGQTVPETEVYIYVNSETEMVQKTSSQPTGDWMIDFDTSQVAEDFHTAKALFQMQVGGNIIKSGFSRSISFWVGQEGGGESCPGADLNRDGRVNLIDFSILLYWWGTNNKCADQDQSGKVDLIDFSIMMYHWTG